MLELKNNKHITVALICSQCSYFKMLLTSHLKCDLAKNNNNITTLICLAISMRANVLHNPLVQYSRGL